MESIDRIKERIRRCLALGDKTRNPSEHEAETAIRMAKNLMDEYHLSMADVVEKEGLGNDIKEQHLKERASPPRWEMNLARVCDHLFATYHYESVGYPDYKRSIVFVGYEQDVALAVEVYKLLKLELLPMGLRWAKQNDDPALTWNQNRYKRCIYLEGVVQTLQHRAYEMSETLSKANAAKVTALVVRKQDNAKAWANEKHQLKSIHRRGTNMHDDAFSDGIQDGKNLSLNFRSHVSSGSGAKPLAIQGGN